MNENEDESENKNGNKNLPAGALGAAPSRPRGHGDLPGALPARRRNKGYPPQTGPDASSEALGLLSVNRFVDATFIIDIFV